MLELRSPPAARARPWTGREARLPGGGGSAAVGKPADLLTAALVDESESRAAEILAEFGIDPPRVWAAVRSCGPNGGSWNRVPLKMTPEDRLAPSDPLPPSSSAAPRWRPPTATQAPADRPEPDRRHRAPARRPPLDVRHGRRLARAAAGLAPDALTRWSPPRNRRSRDRPPADPDQDTIAPQNSASRRRRSTSTASSTPRPTAPARGSGWSRITPGSRSTTPA